MCAQVLEQIGEDTILCWLTDNLVDPDFLTECSRERIQGKVLPHLSPLLPQVCPNQFILLAMATLRQRQGNMRAAIPSPQCHLQDCHLQHHHPQLEMVLGGKGSGIVIQASEEN